MLLYLDDGIMTEKTLEQATEASSIVRRSLLQAGLVAHPTKSVWQPSHVGQWLGFEIDLNAGAIFIPSIKIAKLKNTAIVDNSLPARAITSKL